MSITRKMEFQARGIEKVAKRLMRSIQSRLEYCKNFDQLVENVIFGNKQRPASDTSNSKYSHKRSDDLKIDIVNATKELEANSKNKSSRKLWGSDIDAQINAQNLAKSSDSLILKIDSESQNLNQKKAASLTKPQLVSILTRYADQIKMSVSKIKNLNKFPPRIKSVNFEDDMESESMNEEVENEENAESVPTNLVALYLILIEKIPNVELNEDEQQTQNNIQDYEQKQMDS